jgi:3-methylfumaryl-CoA hydratase
VAELPAHLTAALDRVVASDDVITAAPVAALWAAFGRAGTAPGVGGMLPPLWHGLFCTPKLPPDRLADDGLPMDEVLLPGIPDLPQRLFAGARFTFHAPLRIGDPIRKESRIARFEPKEGKSGRLLFATVEHRVSGPGELAVTEENDIVYRKPAGGSGGAPPSPTDMPETPWRMTIDPDPVLLFRHSAATFNSHRVHYDRPYAQAHGMPGLLVQGMLIARLMLELVNRERPGAAIARFSFRSGRPLYDTAPFTLAGAPAADGTSARLWAIDSEGGVAMTAEAGFG